MNEITNLLKLAGINNPLNINETVQLPQNPTIEDLTQRIDACQRALKLIIKLKGADRKKWLVATFHNLGIIRRALKDIIDADSGDEVNNNTMEEITIQQLRQLSGINVQESDELVFEEFDNLEELVQLPADLTIEDCIKRLDACKRALALANKLKGPDKKKWVGATFGNLNRVSAALKRLMKAEDTAQPAANTPAAPQSAPQQGGAAPQPSGEVDHMAQIRQGLQGVR